MSMFCFICLLKSPAKKSSESITLADSNVFNWYRTSTAPKAFRCDLFLEIPDSSNMLGLLRENILLVLEPETTKLVGCFPCFSEVPSAVSLATDC